MSTQDVQWVERKLGRSISKGRTGSNIIQDDDDAPVMPPRPNNTATATTTPSTPPPPPAAAAAAAAASSSSSSAAAEQPKPIFAKKEQKKVNREWDWFDWFMMIGIPMEASLKYSASFQSDKLDDSDIPNLTHKRIKMLGVSEKHTRRIERYIETEKVEPLSDEEGNQDETNTRNEENDDEAFARRLHRELNGAEASSTTVQGNIMIVFGYIKCIYLCIHSCSSTFIGT